MGSDTSKLWDAGAGVRGLAVVLLATSVCAFLRPPGTPRYEVYAVRFAHVTYPTSSLVAGVPRGTTTDIAFTVWPIRAASGRVLLFDSGFYRDQFLQRWHPSDYVKPSEAVAAALGITPDDVTDLVISHVHWDHADGADLFPRATIWIQKDEYEYYVSPDGTPLHNGVEAVDAAMLASLKAAGRVRFIDGDNQEIIPGIRAYTGGKHTYASQYLSVQTRSGTVVLASDNAYLYQNLESHLAIAQTLDAASNLAAQGRMLTLAASPKLVIPGHDPQVFVRFPVIKPNVVRID
jgi:glyoxylase-like metal-dependent hydrolase (beta-lactamase superfamily II)